MIMINDKLKKLRKDKHYTQEEAAEHLGVSAQTVSKWERGLALPDAAVMIELCKILFEFCVHLVIEQKPLDLVFKIDT